MSKRGGEAPARKASREDCSKLSLGGGKLPRIVVLINAGNKKKITTGGGRDLLEGGVQERTA